MNNIPESIREYAEYFGPYLIIFVYYIGFYEVFFHEYVYESGDHVVAYFSNQIVLDGLLNNFEIPIWNPYLNNGSIDIWAILVFHPLIILFSLIFMGITYILSLDLNSYSIFMLSYLTFYLLTYGLGCWWLAKEYSKNRMLHLTCFAIALLGPQMWGTFKFMQYNTFFIPFWLLSFLRIFIFGKVSSSNIILFILSTGLLSSQAFGWIGHIASFYTIAFCSLFLAGWQKNISTIKRILHAALKSKFIVVESLSLMLSMFMYKFVMGSRIGEFQFPQYKSLSPTSDYWEFIVEHFSSIGRLLTGKFSLETTSISTSLFSQTIHHRSHYFMQDLLSYILSYTPEKTIFFVSTPFLIAFLVTLDRKLYQRIKYPALILFLLCCLSTKDSPASIKYLAALLNPLYFFGTQHFRYIIMFAPPMLCCVLVAIFDKLFSDYHERTISWIKYGLSVLVAGFLSLGVANYGVNSIVLACIFSLFLALSIYRQWPSSVVTISLFFYVILEFTPIYRGIFKFCFSPFATSNLSKKHNLEHYPGVGGHIFSYWMQDQPSFRGLFDHPNNNMPYLKAFTDVPGENLFMKHNYRSSGIFRDLWIPKVFMTDCIVPVAGTEVVGALNMLKADNFLNNCVPAEENLWKNKDLKALSYELNTVKNTNQLTFPHLQPRLTDIKVFEKRINSTDSPILPPNFPKYLSTNPFNPDIQFISAKLGGRDLTPTFFQSDVAKGKYQIIDGKIEVGDWSDQNHAEEQIMISFRGPKASEHTQLENFSYNRAEFEVNAPNRSVLIYLDRVHKFWRANVNGKDQNILRLFDDYKGVLIEAGRNKVKFIFDDLLLTSSLWLLIISTIISFFITIVILPKGH